VQESASSVLPTIFSWKYKDPRLIQSLVKKRWSFICVLLSLFFSCAPKETWNTTTFIYFDTVCEVKVFCSSSRFKAAQTAVKNVFKGIEIHFSPGSTDYTSPEVLSLFQKAYAIYKNSQGKFDISVGALSQIWGFHDQSFRIPTTEDLTKAKRIIGMDKMHVQDGQLVLVPGARLDWGGIAKGYGIDLVSLALLDLGITKGFVNAGGDLYCWGTNPNNLPWKIGIKHPRKSGFSGILSIYNEAAATTGDYQRYFVEKGTRYHHVFDPHSGYPARGKQSVTVVGPEAVLCDALSTALFVSTQPKTILDLYPQYGAIIIDSDGNISSLGKPVSFEPTEELRGIE
jgi:thiamine biosynthesis lipoprotein